VDVSAAAKRRYALVLWGGMVLGWAVTSFLCWLIISSVFG
jgi:hypothetical protein